MSEPSWKGKTCKELEGLRVKVTFVSGATLDGILHADGHIYYSSNYAAFRPFKLKSRDYRLIVGLADVVKSVELLDDPEYERIDSFEDVRKGDIFVSKTGNKYPVFDATFGMLKGQTPERNDFCSCLNPYWFAYALRRKPQLPDKPGLWEDKNGDVWVYADNSFSMRCIGGHFTTGAREWTIRGTVRMVDHSQDLAPFRPYKLEGDE
ncbi:hypothetical protein [Bifidobacterium olomucense]|uniref:Uncharacterized protein n=1 Tax=Bifidobacterium olomucense TaxID=2675324 RepID=A0A7Y0EXB4_9BIFI|nr:hypothetical protein [Bifidobacterium sp. DSM 109959]NMM98099.1 hypothetical protein [Bifidobacterium sp. DSM 109959]